jgi:hypothetical protein
LLLKTGASKAVVHACLAVFVLLPITPLLAAQVNYDNLLLPFTAWLLLLAVSFSEAPNVRRLLGILTACLVGGLIEFAFLPIALAVFAYTLWVVKRQGSGPLEIKSKLNWLLVVVLLLSGFLFAERYGLNLAHYHSPVPNCDKILGDTRCDAYGPWQRDNQLKQLKGSHPSQTPFYFGGRWFYGMWLRTFFAVDGPGTLHQTRGPLLLPGVGAIIVAAGAITATALKWRQVLGRYNRRVLWLLAAVSGFYLLILVLQEYQAFIDTGQAVAINGRYLLLIYPLLFIIGALSLDEALRSRPNLKAAAAGLAIVCLLWGGGALTFILRSNDSWYWPSQAVGAGNHAVKRILGPVTPGYKDYLEFLRYN